MLVKFIRRSQGQSNESFGVISSKADQPPTPPLTSLGAHLPYRRRDYLLTSAEKNFYLILKQVADQLNYVIFAKVRLEDLIWIPKYTPNLLKWRGYVRSRHIDFILCDNQQIRPLLAIELDDSSHMRWDRMDRDAKVDRILGDAGLPILHVKNQYSYVLEGLITQIKNKCLK